MATSMELRLTHKISEIGAERWNALRQDENPFTRYEFLYALEASGSVSADTGWQPLHLQVIDNDKLIALLPLYLKNHSYGEYVFDWAWADAYHRHGLKYYPKLLNAIPFSPIESAKLLTKEPKDKLFKLIHQQLPNICEQVHAQSWHSLFLPTEEQQTIQQENSLIRLGCQYHWFNRGYKDFNDYLSRFTSRKRKNLKKERKKILEHGITHIRLTGEKISDDQLNQFFEFYRLTYVKRGREAYLNKKFFFLLRELLPEQLLLVLALKDDQPVAAALSLKDNETLYGRYWGCYDEYDSLHFETCYYQGIEYCIEHNLQSFNSGAQGEHKIQRGFEPIPTHSAHWLKEQGFNQAIKQFVAEEYKGVQDQIDHLKTYLPFKKTDR